MESQEVFRVSLCGPFWVEQRVGEQWVAITTHSWCGRTAARTICKALLCSEGRQLRRDALLTLLWPDEDPRYGADILQKALPICRRIFGDQSETVQSPSLIYRLAGQASLWVDVDAACDLLTRAEREGRISPEAVPLLEEAAGYLRRGVFLEEEDGAWVRMQRERIERLRTRAQMWLAEAYVAQGNREQAEQVLTNLWEHDPFDEAVLRQLLILLHQQGRTRQAQRLYRQAQELFAQEELPFAEETERLADSFTRGHRGQTPEEAVGTSGSTFPPSQGIIQEGGYPGGLVVPMTPGGGVQGNLFGEPGHVTPAQVFDEVTLFTAKIVNLVVAWKQRALQCVELQALLSQEFSMFEKASRQNPLSRRQALGTIAVLPSALIAACTQVGTTVVAEEFLPQCTASLTACWHLMQGQEFLMVEQVLTQSLPALTTLAQQALPYQQVAAGLASQSHFLLGHLAMHKMRFQERMFHCQQAAEYGKVANDRNLQVSALCNLAGAYNQLGNLTSQLHTGQQVARMLDELPMVLQSKALGTVAHAYAKQLQVQKAEQYIEEARIVLTSEAREQPLPLYLAFDYGPIQAMQWEAQTWLELGQYQRAAEAFEQLERFSGAVVIPERIQVEIVNQKAQVATQSGDLDRFCTLLVQGATDAQALASKKRQAEVVANWKAARARWPSELRVLELADVLLA